MFSMVLTKRIFLIIFSISLLRVKGFRYFSLLISNNSHLVNVYACNNHCDPLPDHRKLIGTVVSREDYLVPKAGGVFDAEEYDAHPDRYRSTFAEKVICLISSCDLKLLGTEKNTTNSHVRSTICR